MPPYPPRSCFKSVIKFPKLDDIRDEMKLLTVPCVVGKVKDELGVGDEDDLIRFTKNRL